MKRRYSVDIKGWFRLKKENFCIAFNDEVLWCERATSYKFNGGIPHALSHFAFFGNRKLHKHTILVCIYHNGKVEIDITKYKQEKQKDGTIRSIEVGREEIETELEYFNLTGPIEFLVSVRKAITERKNV